MGCFATEGLQLIKQYDATAVLSSKPAVDVTQL